MSIDDEMQQAMAPRDGADSTHVCAYCWIASLAGPAFRAYSGPALPERSLLNCYAADVSIILAMSIDAFFSDSCSNSTFTKNRKTQWHTERAAISAACAIAFVASITGYEGLVRGQTGQHLRKSLDRSIPGGSSLLDRAGKDDFASLATGAARLADESLARNGLKAKNNILLTSMVLAKMITSTYLETVGQIAGKEWTSVMQPLRSAAAKSSSPEVRDPIRAAPSVAGAGPAEPTAERPTRAQYDGWVQQCLGWATARRLPERLVSDLIPPFEVAAHDIIPWEERLMQLEVEYPGRREWARAVGVSIDDEKDFWGLPMWVQEFAWNLMRRNLDLDIRFHTERGESFEEAAFLSLVFTPHFSLSVPDVEDDDNPLPLELFLRSIRYFADKDQATLERQVIASRSHSASGLLRHMIALGVAQ